MVVDVLNALRKPCYGLERSTLMDFINFPPLVPRPFGTGLGANGNGADEQGLSTLTSCV